MQNLRTYGSEPYTVAVIHGVPGAPGSMAPVARELAASGFGVLEPWQTAASLDGQIGELHTVLSTYGHLPVTLIGWSWGAMLSFITAARHPAAVHKLILRMRRAPILWCAAVIVTLFFLPSLSRGESSGNEALIYAVNNSDGEVTYSRYDPGDGSSTPIFTHVGFLRSDPVVSMDGRIAFQSPAENGAVIHIVDSWQPDMFPVRIGADPTTINHPLAWSLDGTKLAIGSIPEDDQPHLFVWDGQSVIDVTPDIQRDLARDFPFWVSWGMDGQLAFIAIYSSNRSPEAPESGIFVWDGNTIIDLSQEHGIYYSYPAWSTDGRLAFSAGYSSMPGRDPGEVFVWDGNTIINISQNPMRDDQAPIWSPDGQLAFRSASGDEYDIFVWDGNDVPNSSPPVNIAPDLTTYSSHPIWTPAGHLAFEATGPEDNWHQQIYLWDGQTVINISQNPTQHNGCPQWSNNGDWAFITFYSAEQLIYVRDANNRPLLTTKGQYCPAWSLDGYLVFCTLDRSDWVLSMWDGHQVTEVTRGGEIWAKWLSGSRVVCSSG